MLRVYEIISIRIENQDPISGCISDGACPGRFDETNPAVIEGLCAQTAGNFHRPVIAHHVNDDHLVNPGLHRLNGVADVAFLVQRHKDCLKSCASILLVIP